MDNCRDIRGHDPKLGRAYLAESAALLEVLADGDPRLFRRAQKAVAERARRLGLPTPPQGISEEDDWQPGNAPTLARRRALRLFTQAFTARDVARPLRSFDLERPPNEILDTLQRFEIEVEGLRRHGVCVGFDPLSPWTRKHVPRDLGWNCEHRSGRQFPAWCKRR
jgi:hypothetical protein